MFFSPISWSDICFNSRSLIANVSWCLCVTYLFKSSSYFRILVSVSWPWVSWKMNYYFSFRLNSLMCPLSSCSEFNVCEPWPTRPAGKAQAASAALSPWVRNTLSSGFQRDLSPFGFLCVSLVMLLQSCLSPPRHQSAASPHFQSTSSAATWRICCPGILTMTAVKKVNSKRV